jgi:hypothetical protein
MKKPLQKILAITAFIALVSLEDLSAQVVPNIDWVATYTEKNTTESAPSAIDANNNVYVTGYTIPGSTGKDITTVKYDPSGNVLWKRFYDNIGGTDDSHDIKIDAAGNVYVIGESDGTGTGRDFVIIKYDANGNLLWVKRFNGAGNSTDVATEADIDAAGNIYVTGKSIGTGANFDYVTLKFNSAGTQLWSKSFNGTGNGDDIPSAIGVGSGNQVFITGTSKTTANGNDIVTLSLNTNNGAQTWVKNINGTANGNDIAGSLHINGTDVEVCGVEINNTTLADYVITKYKGNNGSILWNATYDGYGANDGASSLIVDASGNTAVTGISFNGTSVEYHTLLYNNAGVFQWVQKNAINLTSYNVVPKIAVDPLVNHFYICGEKGINNTDICVYQVTPGGNKTWEETYNGSANGKDVAVDFVVNSQAVIYVLGFAQNLNVKFDYTTIRISQTPLYPLIDYNNETSYEPYYFYENQGQILTTNNTAANEVKYYTTNASPQLFFQNTLMSFVFAKIDTSRTTDNDTVNRVDLSFPESNIYAQAHQESQKPVFANYYLTTPIGAVSKAGIHGFERIMIPNIYPNIDLHYSSNNKGLKYYFVIKPGGDPKVIRNFFSRDVTSSNINTSQGLDIVSSMGNIHFQQPIIYQVNFMMQIVNLSSQCFWQSSGTNDYGFTVGSYNTALPLIIEVTQGTQGTVPIQIGNINWSTYYGGTGADNFTDIAYGNADQQTMTTGITASVNYPTFTNNTSGIYQGANGGGAEATINQFNDLGAR